MRLKASAWFEGAILIMCVVMFFTAFGYNPRARFMPEIFAAVLFVLTMLVFLWDNVPAVHPYLGFMKQKGYFTDQSSKKDGEAESSESGTVTNHNAKLVRIIIWLIGFVVLLKFVTYLITIPVWVLFFTKFEGGRSWKGSFGSAIGMAVFDYVLFAVLLNTSL